jgi:hypothetical protein
VSWLAEIVYRLTWPAMYAPAPVRLIGIDTRTQRNWASGLSASRPAPAPSRGLLPVCSRGF